MNLFSPLDAQVLNLLDELILLIDKTFPLPRKFYHVLPRNVAELSGLYTAGRGDRSLTYLGKPNLLSAYLRYFLPWNVFRLCKLLPSLSLEFRDDDVVLDIGCGPLTLALALWISRPDLRGVKMEFVCLDRTPSVLDAGKKIFAGLTGAQENCPWKIRTVRGEITGKGYLFHTEGKRIPVSPAKLLHGKTAALAAAVNIFNEIYWDLSPADRGGLETLTQQYSSVFSACSGILIIEPGIPRSAEFISCFRSSLLERDFRIESPCLHEKTCPFPGGLKNGKKAKWCHFPFIADEAPAKLRKLSEAAGIPKERAVLSFLLAKKSIRNDAVNSGKQVARIISDSFPVGAKFGCYSCSSKGAVLVTGEKTRIESLESGETVKVKFTGQTDQKSGAYIGELDE